MKTKEKILQAALELFVSKGYHGTSIRDITREVNVTKGALYAHFESKKDIVFRIIDRFSSEYIDNLFQSIREHPGDALSKLHHAISFSSGYALKNPNLSLFLTHLATELNADPSFRPALKKVYHKYHAFIQKVIEQGIREGVLRKTLDPNMAAFTYVAVREGVFQQWTLNRGRMNGKKFVKEFRSILIKGMMK